ncbi:glycosyltransferase [Flavimarina sp. Hel_I_48]|uniref:glycosyltransferase n=1 Tax=Flavimarina sp. Hel_I_48 TaxID=1392488 RepID=UPI00068ECB01|nr:glycosyltransferase [Flavimarina sp. Hel_I_48]
MSQPRYKIAILIEALSNGGAERSAGLLSKIMEDLGHEVYVVTITDAVAYPFSGELVNLGLLKNKQNDVFNKLKRFTHFKGFLEQKEVDFLLDFRLRKNYFKEWLLANFLYKDLKVIYMVRSSHLNYYFPKNDVRTRKLFSQAFNINCVSHGIKENIETYYKLNNVSFIKNPVAFDEIELLANEESNLEQNYILAAGRMSLDIKQFDKLIATYAASDLPQKGIALKLLGEGKYLAEYQKRAAELQIAELVHFEGFKQNPFPYFKNALFTVLCSKFEGSPRVLLESLACGTPVVAMDCPTGPAEIVQQHKNGILLPENDFAALKNALNFFTENYELRTRCARYAKASIQDHGLQEVGKAWEKLLNSAS